MLAKEKESTSKIQKEIDDSLNEINEILNRLIEGKAQADTLKEKISSESFSLTNWIGDNITRPGNDERKNAAINSLKSLNETIDLGISEINDFKDKCSELRMLMVIIEEEWLKAIQDIIPLIKLSFYLPGYSNAISEFFDLTLSIFTFVDAYLLKKALKTTGATYWKALGWALAIEALILIIGGIIAGEKRKEMFENIEKEANKARNSINKDVIDKLKKTIIDIDLFFSDIKLSYTKAGLTEPNKNLSNKEIIRIVQNQATNIKLWRKSYNKFKSLSQSMELNKAIDLVITLIIEDEEDEKERNKLENIFKAIYIFEINKDKPMSLNEINKKLKISEKDILKAKTLQMLIDKKNPREIAKELNVVEDEIIKIIENEETNKKIVRLEKMQLTAMQIA